MNILVINGSPKGSYSITLKTAEYIEKHNKEHDFKYLCRIQIIFIQIFEGFKIRTSRNGNQGNCRMSILDKGY